LEGAVIDPRLFLINPSEVGEGGVLTVVFPRADGVVRGRVAAVAETGETVAIKVSRVWNEDEVFSGPRSIGALQPTPVGDDGEFRLQRLPAGKYQLQVVALQESGEWQALSPNRAAVVTVGPEAVWSVSVEL
jgi:hypothetical protein